MRALITGIVIFNLVLCTPVSAKVRRMYSDSKLPTQQMVEKQTFTNPIFALPWYVINTTAGSTSAAIATVTTFNNQPDVTRNIVITPNTTSGIAGDIESCTIVVNGTNYKNDAISEEFAFSADQTSAVVGDKAFKTLTSVVFPANCESGGFNATWDVGVGSKLGVKECMAQTGHILFSTLNGSKEATAPTMAVNASSVQSNTATFNGTLNGSNDFELFFIQNFGCL